jgi:hypothetical protein
VSGHAFVLEYRVKFLSDLRTSILLLLARWAPLSALAVSVLFKSRAVGAVDFVKEALPFSDVLPVATLSWALKYLYPDSKLTKLLGLSNLNTDVGQTQAKAKFMGLSDLKAADAEIVQTKKLTK